MLLSASSGDHSPQVVVGVLIEKRGDGHLLCRIGTIPGDRSPVSKGLVRAPVQGEQWVRGGRFVPRSQQSANRGVFVSLPRGDRLTSCRGALWQKSGEFVWDREKGAKATMVCSINASADTHVVQQDRALVQHCLGLLFMAVLRKSHSRCPRLGVEATRRRLGELLPMGRYPRRFG